MTEAWAYAGGALLAAATLPQAIMLWRTRDATAFGWAFTLLNFIGISMLAIRSWEIHEWGFVTVNLITAAFWALVLGLKLKPHEAQTHDNAVLEI